MASAGAAPAARARLNIALGFHSLTSGNLGVGALTVANMAIAEAVAAEEGFDVSFVAISMRDGDLPEIGDGAIPSIFVDRRGLTHGALWKAIGAADCLLDISGGDSFADIYGGKRLFFLSAVKILAIMRGTPLVLSPMTIGPFDRPRNRRLAAWIMRRGHAVMARDDKSFAYARAVAPDARVVQSSDVAFVLPFEDRSAMRGGARIRVGLNVSALLFDEAERGSNRFGLAIDYAAFTRRLIETLLARGDVEVHLVPHVFSRRIANENDGRLADRLKADYPALVRPADFDHPSTAKSYISSLDLLVAGRMHACIGAFSAGTPVVPVAYSRKFGGLFGTLGYDWMIPVTGMDEDRAIDFVGEAIAQRATLAAEEARGMRQVGALLDAYRDELRTLFRTIGDRR